MKLHHKQIPEEFRSRIPAGMKLVRRKDQDFLVVGQLFCQDGHSLMVDSVRMHGEPSVHLKLSAGGVTGSVFVDAYWGSHDKLYGFLPEPGWRTETAAAACPVCGLSLMVSAPPCRACGGTQHIQLLLPGGKNRILVCARLGCPEHRLLADDLPTEIVDWVSDINYFGL